MAASDDVYQCSNQVFSLTSTSLALQMMDHNTRKITSPSCIDHPLLASADSGVSVETISMETVSNSERTGSVSSIESCPARFGHRPSSASGSMGHCQRAESASGAMLCPGNVTSCLGNGATARPSSALTRGVQIVEYCDTAVRRLNPEPIASVNEESLVLMEEYLSPHKLRALTGIDDLQKVQFLEMRVDTRDTSLGNFGTHLSNLVQLKLSNSIISSVRDLGSCLTNVRVLWMARCSTTDLDGLAALSNLQELYVAYNDIVDISPCSLLENIQVIDLEGNNIDDITQVEFLALCQHLTCLTLEGNPVCSQPSPTGIDSNYDYRMAVKRILPQLQSLDDEPLLDEDQHSSRATSAFDEDWKLLDELAQEGMMLPADKLNNVPGRPSTAWTESIPYRPGSALKPPPTALCRPGSSALGLSPRQGSAPGTADSGRPSTSSRTRSADSAPDNDVDVTCELTTGAVVCGNVSRALKGRKRDNSENIARKAEKYLAQFQYKAEHSYDTKLEDDDKIQSIMEELQQWKEQHQKRLKEIEASRAPQILTISYDDEAARDVSSSDSVADNDDDDDVTDDEIVACSELPPALPPLLMSFDASIGQQTLLPSIESAGVTHRPDVTKEDAVLRKLTLGHVGRTAFAETSSSDSLESATSTSNVSSPVLIKRHSANSMMYNSLVGCSDPLCSPPADCLRPVSGPIVTSRRKFKLEPVVDKSQPKIIDPKRPIVCGLTSVPEVPKIPDISRIGTSRASLGQPSGDSISPSLLAARVPASLPGGGSSSVRRGHLSTVQLLPDKFK